MLFSIENDVVFAKYVVFAKHMSFSIENDVVFDRPVRNRPIKKLKVVNCWLVKLMYHNAPNHPAKYGGLGFRSRKVRFRLVNRVSLIFKVVSPTPDTSSLKKYFFSEAGKIGCALSLSCEGVGGSYSQVSKYSCVLQVHKVWAPKSSAMWRYIAFCVFLKSDYSE